MPEAPRLRPRAHTVLLVSVGHVVARPGPVFDALVGRLGAGSRASDGFVADPVASLAVVQGRWWYRAEYRVVPDDTGSRVEFTLVNVASRMHRTGPALGRKTVAAAPAAFGRLVKQLREELE